VTAISPESLASRDQAGGDTDRHDDNMQTPLIYDAPVATLGIRFDGRKTLTVARRFSLHYL
jgi:hypothetical protein